MNTKITFISLFLLGLLLPLKAQIILNESNTPHSPNLIDERLLSYTPIINFELEGENIQKSKLLD